jgi:hypothetical protein
VFLLLHQLTRKYPSFPNKFESDALILDNSAEEGGVKLILLF